jgi:predicted transcriptional regulator
MQSKEAHIAVRIEEAKLADLQRIAKKKDRSVSYLIRKAIDEFLKRERTNATQD